MDFFKYTINEDEWNIYLTDDDDNVVSEEGSAAETDFDSKEIHFRRGEVELRTVMHELWHVYFGYCYLDDTTELSLGDTEEITATMFADKAEKIIARAKDIHNKLLELRDKPNEQRD